MTAGSLATMPRPAPARGGVRPFRPDDLPAVVGLHREVFVGASARGAGLETFLRELFCGHPWDRDVCQSLVYESEPGYVTGCLGVMPRPMLFRGRPLLTAVSHHFMVASDQRHSMAALQLMRAFLAGPQQLSLAEGNDLSRRMWAALHGVTVPFYSLHWTRPLRPVAYGASTLATGRLSRLSRVALGPAIGLADMAATTFLRRRYGAPATPLSASTLDDQALLDEIRSTSAGFTLGPDYTLAALRWMLRVIADKPKNGTVHRIGLTNARGDRAGWYVYRLQPGAPSEVLQFVARDGAHADVFSHLLAHAAEGGATAVTGRAEPGALAALAGGPCWFRAGGSWLLLHSRRGELLDAIYRGDAFLSPLEGEWWIGF